MINLVIGVLLHKGILDYKEAEHLAKSLNSGVIAADFGSAMRQIEEMFKSYNRAQKKRKEVVANKENV